MKPFLSEYEDIKQQGSAAYYPRSGSGSNPSKVPGSIRRTPEGELSWNTSVILFPCVCLAAVCLSVCVWTVKRTQTGCSSRGGELRGAFGLGGGGQRWGRWLTHKVPAAAINRPVCWFKDERTGPLTHTRSRCSISDGCFIRRTHTPRMLHGVSAVVHVICTSPAFTKRTSD